MRNERRRGVGAAMGSVDKQELETLMARGLAPEQAVELIVSGILR